MMSIKIEIKVGYLERKIIDILDIDLKPGEIKLLPGGIKHICRKRLDCFNKYFSRIPEIIKSPDYVGVNPKYQNSIEYIKEFTDNILVAIRLQDSGSFSVVTMFYVTDSKISSMLRYGRIKKL